MRPADVDLDAMERGVAVERAELNEKEQDPKLTPSSTIFTSGSVKTFGNITPTPRTGYTFLRIRLKNIARLRPALTLIQKMPCQGLIP
jgi:hypothetical protein